MRGNLGTHPDRLRAITVGAFGTVFPLGILPIALAFGLTVTAMAYTVGPVSGAHLNPAVTVSLWVAGRIRTEEAFGESGAQLGTCGLRRRSGTAASLAVPARADDRRRGFRLAGEIRRSTSKAKPRPRWTRPGCTHYEPVYGYQRQTRTFSRRQPQRVCTHCRLM